MDTSIPPLIVGYGVDTLVLNIYMHYLPAYQR